MLDQLISQLHKIRQGLIGSPAGTALQGHPLEAVKQLRQEVKSGLEGLSKPGSAGTVGIGALISQLHKNSLAGETPKPSMTPEPADLANMIGAYETRGVKNPSTFINPSGGAMGTYQVKPDTLKTYSKKYLGREVTPKEFLANPSLQDKFITNTIQDWRDRFHLTDEEIIKAWNQGLNGDFNSSAAQEYLKRVTQK